MRLRPRVVALALCAAGCGPPPAPARPDPSIGKTVQYRPLEMASDARRADRAVILGTDDRGGSTVLALAASPMPIVVVALGVSAGDAASGTAQAIVLTSASPMPSPQGAARGDAAGTGDGASAGGGGAARSGGVAGGGSAAGRGGDAANAGGGAASAGDGAAAAEPIDAGPLQIGGTDDGAAGARWRADAWTAAAVAAAAMGKELADVRLSATPAGPMAGTASGLVAGGFIAALLGDSIDPAATLAGAVLPDGSIAPVAGLPEQVAAAIERGKTRIGVPGGMRTARSAATGKDVDLAQLARRRSAEVIEVGDARDAYRVLTGHRLPAPLPVAAAAMVLEPAASARIDARYLTWQGKLAEEWAPLLQLEQSGRLPGAVAALVRAAHRRSERAEALHRGGKVVAAYGEVVAAWLYAAAANRTHAVIGRVAAGDLDGARAAIAALDGGDAAFRASLARIGAVQPTTLAGHLAMLAGLEALLRGSAHHALGAEQLRAAGQALGALQGTPPADRGSPVAADAVAAAVAPAAMRLLRAAADAAVAEQELELAPEGAAGGITCACEPAAVARSAAALGRVAAAALAHADALIVEPAARRAGLDAGAARWRIAAAEPGYLLADQLGREASLPRELAAAWSDGSLATGLLALAAARTAYHGAALAIAKHDAAGAHREAAGRDASRDGGRSDAPHPAALRAMLSAAERAARAAARESLIATGAVPVQARLAYQIAAVAAAGALDDQLDALAQLWTATAFSRTAVALARACR